MPRTLQCWECKPYRGNGYRAIVDGQRSPLGIVHTREHLHSLFDWWTANRIEIVIEPAEGYEAAPESPANDGTFAGKLAEALADAALSGKIVDAMRKGD
jgi:hypothetical protein